MKETRVCYYDELIDELEKEGFSLEKRERGDYAKHPEYDGNAEAFRRREKVLTGSKTDKRVDTLVTALYQSLEKILGLGSTNEDKVKIKKLVDDYWKKVATRFEEESKGKKLPTIEELEKRLKEKDLQDKKDSRAERAEQLRKEQEEARKAEEAKARKAEEETRKAEEEEARKVAEEARKVAEEARKAEEEEARKVAEEARKAEEKAKARREERARKEKEYEARRKEQEEARRKKQEEDRKAEEALIEDEARKEEEARLGGGVLGNIDTLIDGLRKGGYLKGEYTKIASITKKMKVIENFLCKSFSSIDREDLSLIGIERLHSKILEKTINLAIKLLSLMDCFVDRNIEEGRGFEMIHYNYWGSLKSILEEKSKDELGKICINFPELNEVFIEIEQQNDEKFFRSKRDYEESEECKIKKKYKALEEYKFFLTKDKKEKLLQDRKKEIDEVVRQREDARKQQNQAARQPEAERQQQEAARQQQEIARQQQQEQAARQRQQEAERQQREDEAARRQEEDAIQRQQEAERQQQQEQAERRQEEVRQERAERQQREEAVRQQEAARQEQQREEAARQEQQREEAARQEQQREQEAARQEPLRDKPIQRQQEESQRQDPLREGEEVFRKEEKEEEIKQDPASPLIEGYEVKEIEVEPLSFLSEKLIAVLKKSLEVFNKNSNDETFKSVQCYNSVFEALGLSGEAEDHNAALLGSLYLLDTDV